MQTTPTVHSISPGVRACGRWSTFIGAILLAIGPIKGAIILPVFFGDHAVLQRDRPVRIWGTAAPNEPVEVTLSTQRRVTQANASGQWEATLPPLPASAVPVELVVRGRDSVVTRHDLLVGDVWLCSGQSNMRMSVVPDMENRPPVANYQEELRRAHLDTLRLFRVEGAEAASPQADAKGEWLPCSAESLQKNFTAVGYFFGRNIVREIGVPVGLIESTWGGTRIEPWTPAEAFARNPGLEKLAKAARTPGASAEGVVPSTRFNAMIHPLVKFTLRGVLWYQGESNVTPTRDGGRYAAKLEALILGWRTAWNDLQLPFYYVQIAPYLYHVAIPEHVVSAEELPLLWEAQASVQKLPHTGMVVTTDLVDDLFEIHPRLKQGVGERLALLALKETYGRSDVIAHGPRFRHANFHNGVAELSFDHVEGGLASRDQKPLSWFAVAGADGKYYSAEAKIAGEGIIVSAPEVAVPKAVHFGWDEGARPNLVNSAGLPAVPFRTVNPFSK